jgi:3-phosphoshikimate 1-carboxyvinyltransferase
MSASATASKSTGLRGVIHVPGDKSVSHRSVILGSLAQGKTRISNFLMGQDCLATIAAFRAMGVPIKVDGTRVTVSGVGLDGLKEPAAVLDMGNSGTGMRLLSGVLAGQDFLSIMTGDSSLCSRPMMRVVAPLREMGTHVDGREGGEKPPLVIRGGKLRGIEYNSPIASAQVKSSILLAGLYASGPTTVSEPSLSRDHTERMMKAFGVDLVSDGLCVTLTPGKTLKANTINVPGDLSSAAFFIVAASLVPDSAIILRNVGINPTRRGVFHILNKMGANIECSHQRESGGEPVADLTVRTAQLHGVEITHEEVVKAIDEIPILCVAAAKAKGKTVITGAEELRHKESDRLAVMASALRELGAEVEEYPDGMAISGGAKLGSGTFDSHHDHRIAMSLIIAAQTATGPLTVKDTSCIDTSFPGFFDLLQSIGGNSTREESA